MDCTFVALAALKLIGITLATVPAVGVNAEHGAGEYTPHVAIVRDAADCRWLTHEFIHHKQYEVTGKMPTKHEYYLWEREASLLTMYAMAQYYDTYHRTRKPRKDGK